MLFSKNKHQLFCPLETLYYLKPTILSITPQFQTQPHKIFQGVINNISFVDDALKEQIQINISRGQNTNKALIFHSYNPSTEALIKSRQIQGSHATEFNFL